MDEADCAGDRGASTAYGRAAPLCFASERCRQQGGPGAGEDERNDRLSGRRLHGDVRCDAYSGERLLEEHPGRCAWRAHDERGSGELAGSERAVAVRGCLRGEDEQELLIAERVRGQSVTWQREVRGSELTRAVAISSAESVTSISSGDEEVARRTPGPGLLLTRVRRNGLA